MPHDSDDKTAEANIFDTKLEAIQNLMHSRFTGIEKVLDRVVVAVEKQAEQNAAIAAQGVRIAHLEEGLNSHRSAVGAALRAYDKRLGITEDRSKLSAWRIGAAKAVLMAVGGGIVAVLGDHIEGIRHLFHGG